MRGAAVRAAGDASPGSHGTEAELGAWIVPRESWNEALDFMIDADDDGDLAGTKV